MLPDWFQRNVAKTRPSAKGARAVIKHVKAMSSHLYIVNAMRAGANRTTFETDVGCAFRRLYAEK